MKKKFEAFDEALLDEFSKRIIEGDPDAGFDLAQFFWGALPSNEIKLYIAVIEALITQSANLGSEPAKEYLTTMWPDMKNALSTRYLKKKFNQN